MGFGNNCLLLSSDLGQIPYPPYALFSSCVTWGQSKHLVLCQVLPPLRPVQLRSQQSCTTLPTGHPHARPGKCSSSALDACLKQALFLHHFPASVLSAVLTYTSSRPLGCSAVFEGQQKESSCCSCSGLSSGEADAFPIR